MNLTSLPDSLLLQIFSHLSPVQIFLCIQNVCRRFATLAVDAQLWHYLDFSSDPLTICDWLLIDILSKVSCHLRTLNLKGCWLLSPRSFRFLGKEAVCPQLQTLDVCFTKIECNDLLDIAEKHSTLMYLRTEGCPRLASYSHTPMGYWLLPNLRHLSHKKVVTWYPDMNEQENQPEDPELSVGSCPLVEDLQFFGSFPDEIIIEHSSAYKLISKLSLQACGWLSRNALETVLKNLPALRTLDVSKTPLDDRYFEVIAETRPEIEHVVMSECYFVTDIGVLYLAKHCTNLKTLVVNDSWHTKSNITDHGFQGIIKGCSNITSLSLCNCGGVTDIGIQALAKTCVNIKDLNISGCLAVTDHGVTALADHSITLTNLKASECVQLTSRSINKVLEKCVNLEVLILETCHYLKQIDLLRKNTVGGMGGTAEKGATDMLRSFSGLCLQEESSLETVSDSSQSGNVSSIDAQSIWPHYTLRKLDLSMCTHISNDTVKQVALCCPFMTSLTLRGCCCVTDVAVEALVKYCRHLETLDISGGSTLQRTRITDKTLYAISEHASKMRELRIIKNANITLDGIRRLALSCGSLRKFQLSVGAPRYPAAPSVYSIISDIRHTCLVFLDEDCYIKHTAEDLSRLSESPVFLFPTTKVLLYTKPGAAPSDMKVSHK